MNHAGITDVGDLLEGPDRRDFAVTWIGERLGQKDFVASVSPLAWARGGVVPILTIHGEPAAA